jgi:hypothetical protein
MMFGTKHDVSTDICNFFENCVNCLFKEDVIMYQTGSYLTCLSAHEQLCFIVPFEQRAEVETSMLRRFLAAQRLRLR